jgi:hypothetical protein
MNSAKLNDWFQMIGLAAVVGSLIFVGLQLKQADDIAFAELAENRTASEIERRALIAEHAVVWQKACLGSELTAAEKVIAGTIYGNYALSNFNFWVRLEESKISGSTSRFQTDRFAANIYRYPGFQSMANSFSEWDELGARTDELGLQKYSSAIRERYLELQQLEPNPNADVMWCGIF